MRFVMVVVVLLLGLGTTPALAAPGPPGHGEWWFDAWHVQQLWSDGARGQGIVIAEIDTGVNAGLPALSANVLPGKDFGPSGGDGRVDRDTDQFGHGTAMASLMVAHQGQDDILGIAPDAKVLPVAVPITGTTDDAGGDANADLLRAIRWAADHGARIINMSLGAPRDAGDSQRTCPADEQAVIDHALAKGAIVVTSGGNAGDRDSPIEEPSVCLGVISVGAVDSHGTVPKWSSRHPYLTVTAPGVNVPTIGRIAGQAFYGDGTSQAAAITSGGLAVIWSKYPKLSGNQVVARLLATLRDRRTARSPVSGYGSVDVGAAVRAAVPVDAPNPVYAAVAPFLARDEAKASATNLIAPPVPIRRPALPGGYAVRAPAGPLTSGPGLAGVVSGAAGLVTLILLLLVPPLRRRQTRTRTQPPTPEPTAHAPEPVAEAPESAAPAPELAAHAPESAAHAPDSAARAPESAAEADGSAARASQSAADAGESAAHAPESTARAPELAARAPQSAAEAGE